MEVGSMVSHLQHGLSKVTKIRTLSVGGKTKDFAVLTPVLNEACSVMVPVELARDFVRGLTPVAKIEALFERIAPVKYTDTTWNRRYREMSDRMALGTFESWLNVAVELISLRADKDLSFGERKMLEQSIQKMSVEIAAQNTMTFASAESYVTKTLAERVR